MFPIPSALCVCTLTSPPPSAYIFLFSLQLVGFFKPREGPAVLDLQSHVFSCSPRLAENPDYTDLRLVCVCVLGRCFHAAGLPAMEGKKNSHQHMMCTLALCHALLCTVEKCDVYN